jgi:myosin-1
VVQILFLLEMLGVSDASYFYYLNQSGTYEVEGTDDKKEYEETRVTL